MVLRALFLTVAVFAFGAPAAHAAVADDFVPLYDAADGVRGVQDKNGEVTLSFGPKAAKIYRRVRGRRVHVECRTVAGHSMAYWNHHDGGAQRELTLPRRRGAIHLSAARTDADLCTVSVPTGRVTRCLPPTPREEWCARVVVALTEAGRAHIDERSRALELLVVFAMGETDEDAGLSGFEQAMLLGDGDIVRLEGPDASPPAGAVGFWVEGKTIVVAALLRDGTRRFIRYDDEVFSTNVGEFAGLDNEDAVAIY